MCFDCSKGRKEEHPAAEPAREHAPGPEQPGDPRRLAFAFNGLLLGEKSDECFDRPLAPPEQAVAEQVEKLLRDGLSVSDIPKLPSAVPQLLHRLASGYRNAAEVTEFVEQDPALASEVLHLANSPYFRRCREPISTIERAFVYIGENGMRQLLAASLLRPTFEIRPAYFRLFGRRLWQHALDCGHACEVFARKRNYDPSTAFVAGLIHDVAKLVIFKQTLKVFRRIHPDVLPSAAIFQQMLGRYSARLTEAVCRDWNLPPVLKEALGRHRRVSYREMGELGQILYIADVVAETHMLLSEGTVPRHLLMQHMQAHGTPWLSLYEAFPEHRRAS